MLRYLALPAFRRHRLSVQRYFANRFMIHNGRLMCPTVPVSGIALTGLKGTKGAPSMCFFMGATGAAAIGKIYRCLQDIFKLQAFMWCYQAMTSARMSTLVRQYKAQGRRSLGLRDMRSVWAQTPS